MNLCLNLFVKRSSLRMGLAGFLFCSSVMFRIFVYICLPFCPYSLMDRISDSGSDGCGSIPHGGTSRGLRANARSPLLVPI